MLDHYKSIAHTMSEIQNFAFTRQKLAKLQGIEFDPYKFIHEVENTRLTTDMNLIEAFEYEISKL